VCVTSGLLRSCCRVNMLLVKSIGNIRDGQKEGLVVHAIQSVHLFLLFAQLTTLRKTALDVSILWGGRGCLGLRKTSVLFKKQVSLDFGNCCLYSLV
jgi:hypothetical protein